MNTIILLITISMSESWRNIQDSRVIMEHFVTMHECRKEQRKIRFRFKDRRLRGTAQCMPWVDVRK